MTTPFLPALTPDKNKNAVVLPPATGVWADGPAKQLAALAAAIKVPPTAHDVHSVPDPWARVILFDRALYDPTHSLHRQVLGEWRGMLGILGLRERMGLLRLAVKEVELTELKPNEKADLQFFSNVLGRVVPSEEDVLQAGESWRRFYVFRAQNAEGAFLPFGMTSPSTLVATGAQYNNALTQDEVPWFHGGCLTDPTHVLAQKDRKALAEWVLTVKEGLGHLTTQRGGWMLERMEAFAAELMPGSRAGSPDVIFDNDRGLGLDYTMARNLDKAHAPEQRTLSDLLVRTDQPGAPRYVLIDPKAPGKLNLDAREVVVYRDITLASVKVRLPVKPDINAGLLHAGDTPRDSPLHWCTPEFFFEKNLIYEPNLQTSSVGGKLFDPFPGCRPIRMEGAASPRRILVPLREDVLKLFTPDYLQQNFSVEWKGTTSAICRLRLEVQSVMKQPTGGEQTLGTRPLVLEREYAAADLVTIDFLPVLGVWPNFQLPPEQSGENRWKRYYIFESWRGTMKTDDFVIKPPTSQLGQSRKVARRGDTFQVHAVNAFPKYLVCEMAPQESADGFQGTPKGLLLLRAPEPPGMGGGRIAALGIDFGTTGTGIYWSWPSEDKPKPQAMQFHDRLFRVTAGDENDLIRVARDVFIPAQDWATGRILSIHQVFVEPTPTEVLDGHVLFGKEDDPGSFIVGDESGVRANLKWGGDRENEAAMGFLSQLCMQSLVELVEKGANAVTIRYSYPTAFSIENKARFIGIWARVIERLREMTDIHFLYENEQVENREAVAATRFFANSSISKGFLISRGALTIDIGGGTTDIALWNRHPDTLQPTLLAHLSVLFAGRDIFLEPIRKKPAVLLDLDPTVQIKSLTDRTPETDSYNAQLDAIIAACGDRMLKELPARQEKVKDFLAIMSMGLCGLGFYSGLLAGGSAKTGMYKPEEQIPVFVGGNGSRLLKWCAINFFQPGMPIYDKFAACVLQGCQLGDPGVRARVQVVLSPSPKEEVAYGLVAHRLRTDDDSGDRLQIHEDFTNPLAGEDLHMRDGSVESWSVSPTADVLRGSLLRVDHKMPVFRTFLKAAKLTVDEDTLSFLADYVDEQLGEIGKEARKLRGEDADDRALDLFRKEPVFIMALKKLVEMRIDEWVNRA